MPMHDEVAVGTTIPARIVNVQRANLVRYAGASGDFNVIHWNERVATGVGLPNVIAHGMFTMATAGRLLTDWVGDPTRVESYGVRFSSPVPVPDDDKGTDLTISGEVTEKLDGGRVRILLTATIGEDRKVLSAARAVVRLG
jgi:acyl dehydratase